MQKTCGRQYQEWKEVRTTCVQDWNKEEGFSHHEQAGENAPENLRDDVASAFQKCDMSRQHRRNRDRRIHVPATDVRSYEHYRHRQALCPHYATFSKVKLERGHMARTSMHTNDRKCKTISPCCILLWGCIPIECEEKDPKQFGNDSNDKFQTIEVITFGIKKTCHRSASHREANA